MLDLWDQSIHLNRIPRQFLCTFKFEKHKFRKLFFDLSSYCPSPVVFYLKTRFLKLLSPQLLWALENTMLPITSKPQQVLFSPP